MRPLTRLLLLVVPMGLLLLPGQGLAKDDETQNSSQKETTDSPSELFGFGKKHVALTAGYGFTIKIGGRTDDMNDLE